MTDTTNTPVQIPDAAVQEHKPTLIEVLNEMKCRLESPPEPDLVELRIMCNAAIATLTNEGTKPVDVAAVRRQAFEDYSDLLERLVSGVISVGMHDDNSTEMFDVDGASETMADAAAAIRALSAEPAQGKFNGKSEKELFEEWLLEEHLITATWNEQRNCFDEYPAHLAFSAWKAGRAALAQGGGE